MNASTVAGEVIAGVDTHSLTHHVGVVDSNGLHLGDRGFPTTAAGHAALASFVTAFGTVARVGVEGTGSYGAALSRHLRSEGFTVAEVIRPKRAQRRRGKSDPIDAYAAAAQTLADPHLPVPKDTDGLVEQIRVLLTARRSAVKSRSAATRQIKSLLVTAPDLIRDRWRSMSDHALLTGLAATRPDAATVSVAGALGQALPLLARRHAYLTGEIETLDTDLDALVHQANPALVATFGVGVTTAAQLLVTGGDNPDRLHCEAAFAALCGTAPIPASSGKTTRYRLNRGGDRNANCALHHIALVRLSCDERTRDYAARRTTEGKTTREILRCLKRSIAREIWHLLVHPAAVPDTSDLRPLRVSKALTLETAARHFHIWPAAISRLERARTRNDQLAHDYRDWLLQQPDATPSRRLTTLNAT